MVRADGATGGSDASWLSLPTAAICACSAAVGAAGFYLINRAITCEHDAPTHNQSRRGTRSRLGEWNSRSQFEEEVEDVRTEIEALRRTNVHLQRLVQSHSSDPNSRHEFHLTTAEQETLRAVFSCFDSNGNGALTVEDIVQVHSKLGEPLSDTEAQQAMETLDKDKTGLVTFDQFVSWWLESHRGPERGDKYQARFKLIRAKLEDNVNRIDISKIQTQQVAKTGSRRFRVKFYYKQKNNVLRQLSPWHDIPLYNLGVGTDAKILNFICEIPKWTRRKYEIATGEAFNPIKQDVKNGQLRSYQYGDFLFNYGALPQTWEDPSEIPEETGFPGDNDPIDAIEIGTRQMKVGEVSAVKVLGILALIDDQETDWKVICINISDPLSHDLNDIDDVEEKVPGAVVAIREYLRVYKVWSGKPENTYALDEEARPKDFALRIIQRCHKSWQQLRDKKKDTV